MKLNQEQEAQLVRIQGATKRWKEARLHADEIFRKKRDEYIRDFEIEMNKEVALGRRMNMPDNQIAKRGMGYQNGSVAKAAGEAGEAFLTPFDAEAAETPAETPRFALDGDVLTVTYQPEDFAGKIDGITGPQSLTFTLDGDRLTPEGEDYSHPVARLALTPDGRKEISEYLVNNN